MLQEHQRAKVLKKILENLFHKTDMKLPNEMRQKHAGKMMDEEVGPNWRMEIILPGKEMVDEPYLASKPTGEIKNRDEFFYNVRQKLGADGSDCGAPDRADFQDEGKEQDKEALISLLENALEMLRR